MTQAQRHQKAVLRIEGLETMQRLQQDLGNTSRADLMSKQIELLKAKL